MNRKETAKQQGRGHKFTLIVFVCQGSSSTTRSAWETPSSG